VWRLRSVDDADDGENAGNERRDGQAPVNDGVSVGGWPCGEGGCRLSGTATKKRHAPVGQLQH